MRTGRKTPCATCPFRRTTEPGNTGGSQVEVFVGQSHGPFYIPCHSSPNYDQRDDPTKFDHCVGTSVFRSNCGVAEIMPDALPKAEANTDDVFATVNEFVSHHNQCPSSLSGQDVWELVQVEMSKIEVKLLDDDKVRQGQSA